MFGKGVSILVPVVSFGVYGENGNISSWVVFKTVLTNTLMCHICQTMFMQVLEPLPCQYQPNSHVCCQIFGCCVIEQHIFSLS